MSFAVCKNAKLIPLPSPSSILNPKTPKSIKEQFIEPARARTFKVNLLPNFGLNSRYRIVKKIDNGSFGDVYSGYDMIDYVKLAIKCGSRSQSSDQLGHEEEVYKALEGIEGIPKLRWSGHTSRNSKGQRQHAIVIDLQGASLEALFQVFKRFSLGTVLMLSIQILHLLEQVHERGYVHRDIKPDNFVMGVIDPKRPDEAGKVYMVDFGLAKLYRDSLERIVGEKKINLQVKELCKGLPHFFSNYMKYCRTLGFAERPNYTLLRTQMKELLKQSYKDEANYNYDWLREDRIERLKGQFNMQ